MNINKIKSILFLGIGGIGMSALAKYFIAKGIKVYGYDRTASDMTATLIQMNAEVVFVDDDTLTENLYDLVVYTPAMPKDSFLLNYYKQSGIPLMKRSEALGIITQNNFTIAVSGSHGKTTVSSMIAFLLKECGVDCSAFLGGVSVNFNSNYVLGNSNVVVVEADEFDRSFMTLSPDIVVLTSIDTDHLDIYGTRENIVASFQDFLSKLDEKGVLIHNEKVVDHIEINGVKKVYGFSNGDYQAHIQGIFPSYSTFTVNENPEVFKLNYNGRHNIENALAAISVGLYLGFDLKKMADAMEKFRGIKRRFELIYQGTNCIFIDDYAHHPAEIEALVSSVKEIFPGKKILSIFQPHLYSRTKDLCVDFAKSLDLSDEVILLPLYPARELPIEGVTSYIVSEKMKTNVDVVDKADLIDTIKQRKFDVILTIGAGDISGCISDIKNYLSNR
ncbi:MAG: UDP-N-acetylmuramate--L-alanine ligase [Chitinophagales bacterium]|jgi:UDP-N-acetylmuramate--alanine ligase|nr:UDP-N-acetylmuramate--L-alanine ligase [Sphingobacteriales bacterium]